MMASFKTLHKEPRALVSVNMAMTIDGKISDSRYQRANFTSRYDREHLQALRRQHQALVIGAQTLRCEDPPMYALASSQQPLKVFVLSRCLQLQQAQRFMSSKDTLDLAYKTIVTPEATEVQHLACLPQGMRCWRMGQHSVPIAALLSRMYKEDGIAHVLLEGGGELLWDFVKEDCLDHLYLTVAPLLLGGRQAPSLLGGDGKLLPDALSLTLVSCDVVKQELFLHYQRVA